MTSPIVRFSGGMGVPYPPIIILAKTSVSDRDAMTIDADGEKYGIVFIADEDMDIDMLGLSINTVTASGDLDFRVETVGADGNPSGTLWSTNTDGTQNISTTGWKEQALTSNASIRRGQSVALVFERPTASTFNGRPRRTNNDAASNPGGFAFPAIKQDIGGGWVFLDSNIIHAYTSFAGARKVGGNWARIPGVIPSSNFNLTPNVSTEMGVRFKLPFKASIAGCEFACDVEDDFTIKIYGEGENPGGSVLASKVIDRDLGFQTSESIREYRLHFDNDAVVEADAVHRLTVEPSTGNVRFPRFSMPNSSYMAASPGGVDFYRTEDVSGSWSDTASNWITIGLLLNGFAL